jgi:hypothetical protein
MRNLFRFEKKCVNSDCCYIVIVMDIRGCGDVIKITYKLLNITYLAFRPNVLFPIQRTIILLRSEGIDGKKRLGDSSL